MIGKTISLSHPG